MCDIELHVCLTATCCCRIWNLSSNYTIWHSAGCNAQNELVCPKMPKWVFSQNRFIQWSIHVPCSHMAHTNHILTAPFHIISCKILIYVCPHLMYIAEISERYMIEESHKSNTYSFFLWVGQYFSKLRIFCTRHTIGCNTTRLIIQMPCLHGCWSARYCGILIYNYSRNFISYRFLLKDLVLFKPESARVGHNATFAFCSTKRALQVFQQLL